MLRCCVSGCKNRYSPSSRIKFYRIPSGSRPFQVRRRRLWIEAIKRANGSSMDFKRDLRICGAHFISGEASMDQDRPNYVPSVFTKVKQTQSLKKKTKRHPLISARSNGYRKRLRRRAKKADREEETPSESDVADSAAEPSSTEMMETEGELPAQTPSPPSLQKKITGLTEETESKTDTIQSQATSSPGKASPSMTSPVGTHKLDKMNPVVLLKTVIAPVGGYQCELCSQTYISVSQFIKHQQEHEEQKNSVSGQADVAEPGAAEFPVAETQVAEPQAAESPVAETQVAEPQAAESPVAESHVVPKEEPSFPCNMCDRLFFTSQNLKRHKLLHVKDGRKCFKCGVLFCRRHNHVAFQPQIASKTESGDESSTSEEENSDTVVSPEDSLPESVEPQQATETDDNTQSSHDLSPAPSSSPTEVLPGVPPLSSLTRTPGLQSVKPSPIPRPPSPILRFLNNPLKFKSQVPRYPPIFVRQHPTQNPELPSSLKLFSPQHLTSAFLEVQRDYKYILSKPRKVKVEKVVKVEPNEPVEICPDVKPVMDKKEKIAYDLEVEI